MVRVNNIGTSDAHLIIGITETDVRHAGYNMEEIRTDTIVNDGRGKMREGDDSNGIFFVLRNGLFAMVTGAEMKFVGGNCVA